MTTTLKLLAIVALISFSAQAAEQGPEETLRAESEMLWIRVGQMGLLGNPENKRQPVEKWPEKATGLFQGLRKTFPFAINSKEDHLNAISRIPPILLEGKKIGKTVEVNGWFYTSVDLSTQEKSGWFSVIASKKGDKDLHFSYSW